MDGPTVLVTGATGFLGRHLIEHLDSRSELVVGESRRTGFDVTDGALVRSVIERLRPSRIYHLAGPSFVPASKADPTGTWNAHVMGTVNVLEAARRLDPMPRVLLAATADGYHPDPARLPFDESTPQDPENPYAAAKIAQETLGRAWFTTWDLPVVRVRLFNIIGPGQDPRFVASSFARQSVAIALGRQPPVIEVGDLEVARDFIDWRDGIEAMRLALEFGRPGEAYNVASGRPRPLRELLDICLREAGVSPAIVSPPHLARPGQAMVRFGDPRKLERETGWAGAKRPLEESLAAVVEYWRGELGERRRL